MTFQESLTNWFYRNGSREAKESTRVCLLDASGNPIGSDTLKRVMTYALTKDDCVDLGLPSGRLWAKRNLGAATVYGYGWYFDWGNLAAHQEGAGYNFSQAQYNTTPAASISADLTLSQDVVHALLGGNWRMPTKDDFQELYDNCTYGWTTAYQGAYTGMLFMSKKYVNKQLFLPASGYYNSTTLSSRGSVGNYWSLSFNSSTKAYYCDVASGGITPQANAERRYGFSIRPVQ